LVIKWGYLKCGNEVAVMWNRGIAMAFGCMRVGNELQL